ncbi:thiamine biosynthesis protein ThiH [Fervidicella metallireducens AeB]|uniref:Thiamine biosynthesis protein ThiH n=1 Tax=Fervidicella metallireducens AeB TaxID=1403537 RepID=A0A017RVF8_9CLOT|nr:2-iminoacetate synthase ThiH [Fervidicella metallireducens]EYE88662.1 thiamine biosynthesis protein ThiH [Fervidicella metallireducens AeB]
MSFYEEYLRYSNFDFEGFFNSVTKEDVLKVLNKNKVGEMDFLRLLSPAAEKVLEIIAQRAHMLSVRHFGKTILLYTPLYISNYCVNRCAYCSFNLDNNIQRRQLTLEEIDAEANTIAKTGLRHILLLTGESKKETPISYIKDAINILKKYFESITIEIYPLTENEYKEIVESGADGLTIYQEVYDESVYDRVHIAGPKKNYKFRLDAPERGCKAKFKSISIGALLGLNNWRIEAFMSGLHGKYLQDRYTDVEIAMAIPRIRPHVGIFQDVYPVSDKDLVQVMLAYRIFLPYSGINVSTRERDEFRDKLIPLGVTKMSAGVSTEVGGHTSSNNGNGQFEISDKRSVNQIKEAIIKMGYQPIFKDWFRL